MFTSFTKKTRIDDLFSAAQHCNLCARLNARKKVLSYANGNIDSKVLFVAEAPGRLGADRTGIPLYGDRTGDNFDVLLGNIGWDRKNIFISNALLCNPRNENGNNSTPSQDELLNCASYLLMLINILQPEVVVTLGNNALSSLNSIKSHNIILKNDVAKMINWYGRKLFPLYHPGPRALLHRSLIKQRADFMLLDKYVDPIKGIRKRNIKKRNVKQMEDLSVFQKIIIFIAQTYKRLSYFKLTKILYFVDLYFIENFGHSLTGEIYIRQIEGPWPPALKKAIPQLNNKFIRISNKNKIPIITTGPVHFEDYRIDTERINTIIEIANKYVKMNNSNIKTAAYRSKPMRYVLEQEKTGRNMKNVALIYKDKTIDKICTEDQNNK